MYRVLLVDDERPVLESMQKVIDWESLGFTVCRTAESGVEACEILNKMKIDLVITDVRMPNMDGLELAEYIAEYFPGIEMIIISGYDEFDYARSAMRSGVMEYITKPTSRSELERTLSGAARRIQRRADLDNNIRKLKTEVEKRIPVLKNQYFNDWMNQNTPENTNVVQMMQYYRSPLRGNAYQLWCFDTDRYEQYAHIPEMKELLWTQLRMIVREIVGDKLTCDSFTKGHFLYYIAENREGVLQRELTENILEQILSEFQNLTHVSVSAAVSREYESYEKLYQAGRDCETALEERCSRGEGSCIFYEEIQLFPDGGLEHHQELLGQICVKIRGLNKKSVRDLVEKLYLQMQEDKAIYAQFYSQTVLILTELYNVAGKEDTKERIRHEMGNMLEYKTADMLKKLILEISGEIIDRASAETAGKNQKIMEQIVAYVEKHIGEEIALVDVADAVHLSKSYLCSIFKKETGETFFAYLTKVRMEKAKELLRRTDHKVYVIAEMVGYMDYTYFSQVFRKYVGVTAGEYRDIYAGEFS